MRWIALAALAVAGCSSPKIAAAKNAERQYEMEASALRPDKCGAAQKVRQAWREAGDKAEFDRWDVITYNDCSRAERGLR